MVFPMKPKVETSVKMTPSVRYLNISFWSSTSEIKILIETKINRNYVVISYLSKDLAFIYKFSYLTIAKATVA